MHYDGKGGIVYDHDERPDKVHELVGKIERANKTAETYENIGYSGHAHAARAQADRLAKAVSKVLRGEGVSDSEQRAYEG